MRMTLLGMLTPCVDKRCGIAYPQAVKLSSSGGGSPHLTRRTTWRKGLTRGYAAKARRTGHMAKISAPAVLTIIALAGVWAEKG